MRAMVKKWGNSASVRIPNGIMQAANLHLDEAVDVREEDGRIVIEPVRTHTFHLDKLVSGITKKNQHAEIDFGVPLGNELL